MSGLHNRHFCNYLVDLTQLFSQRYGTLWSQLEPICTFYGLMQLSTLTNHMGFLRILLALSKKQPAVDL